MSFRPNTKRVFHTWAQAAEIAHTWAWQTGHKYAIRRVRAHLWRVERTAKPAQITYHTYKIGNVTIVI